MFCKLLTIVLIVASTSAVFVGKSRRQERRQEYTYNCYQSGHPMLNCTLDQSAYQTTRALLRFTSFEDTKTKLKARNAFENICREARQFSGCIANELERSPRPCQKEYATHMLSLDNLNKVDAWLDLACTAENIEILRDSVDCAVNARVKDELDLCEFKQTDKDCSDSDATSDCVRENSQRNCDAGEVVDCQQQVLSKACSREAGDLLGSLGRANFDIFPICPGQGIVKSLFKLFK